MLPIHKMEFMLYLLIAVLSQCSDCRRSVAVYVEKCQAAHALYRTGGWRKRYQASRLYRSSPTGLSLSRAGRLEETGLCEYVEP